jgi:hypothetical protein
MEPDLVTVASYDTPAAAHIAADFLFDAGIESNILNENTTLEYWGSRPELQVSAADAEKARELLKQLA